MVVNTAAGSMLHLFLGLKSLVKVRRYQTDGSVFRLHYKATVMILVICSVLVTSRQYVGDPIDCLVEVSQSESLTAPALITW